MTTTPTKICYTCKKSLPLEAYKKSRTTENLLRTCHECWKSRERRRKRGIHYHHIATIERMEEVAQ